MANDHGLTCPTPEEAKRAAEALDQGNFEVVQSYLERLRDYNLQAAGSPFNREKFVEGRKSRGENINEGMIVGARRLHEELRSWSLADAAKAAAQLGSLASMLSDYATAAKHYAQAAELDPENGEYKRKQENCEANCKEPR